MAAITMTVAPMHPIRFGKLTSGNTPGAQLPSTAFCIVLSNPSLAAAKQHITSPNTSRSRLLRPPVSYIFAVNDRISHKSQKTQDHNRRCRCRRISKIKFHPFFLLVFKSYQSVTLYYSYRSVTCQDFLPFLAPLLQTCYTIFKYFKEKCSYDCS